VAPVGPPPSLVGAKVTEEDLARIHEDAKTRRTTLLALTAILLAIIVCAVVVALAQETDAAAFAAGASAIAGATLGALIAMSRRSNGHH
jgi:hypothetical protein